VWRRVLAPFLSEREGLSEPVEVWLTALTALSEGEEALLRAFEAMDDELEGTMLYKVRPGTKNTLKCLRPPTQRRLVTRVGGPVKSA
jgi:hypothetical protein